MGTTSKSIEEYGLIADGHTVALVARDGAIDWLCWPRFDSAACFAALLGTEENGIWQIAPIGKHEATRRYAGDDLVLVTEFACNGGATLVLTDFMPIRTGEAAAVDGASGLRQFWNITLPLLRPSIAVAMIFRTITSLQTFDIPRTMTRGGPGNATTTLAMYIHQTTVDFLDLGYGSALAVVMFLLSMVVTYFYLRQIRPT